MLSGTGCALFPFFLDVRSGKLPAGILLLALCGAIVYSLLQILAAFRYLAVRTPYLYRVEPISVLKPLSGLDLDLESNLRTFFEQDYPAFEILFAVRREDDPAAEVVARLQREYPNVSLAFSFASSAARSLRFASACRTIASIGGSSSLAGIWIGSIGTT